jgi:hypothetical protein
VILAIGKKMAPGDCVKWANQNDQHNYLKLVRCGAQVLKECADICVEQAAWVRTISAGCTADLRPSAEDKGGREPAFSKPASETATNHSWRQSYEAVTYSNLQSRE